MGELTDRTVLITGAGRGTGRTLAQAFAARGAIVCANDITPINLDETIANITAAGGRARDYVTDISKKLPVQAMLNQIEDEWGRLDILINNAHVDPKKPLLDLDEWDWRRAVDVNLTGAFITMQSTGRIMRAAGGGIIINVLASHPREAPLSASQFGLLRLTEAAARQFSAYNIRVNAVSAGPVGMHAEPIASVHTIAEAVLHLCGDNMAHLTGKIFSMDV